LVRNNCVTGQKHLEERVQVTTMQIKLKQRQAAISNQRLRWRKSSLDLGGHPANWQK